MRNRTRLFGNVCGRSFNWAGVFYNRAKFKGVIGIAPGDQEEMAVFGARINIKNGVCICGEVRFRNGQPIIVDVFDPRVEEFCFSSEGGRNFVAFEIFDEGIIAFEVGAACDGGKRNHVDPLFLFGVEEVPGVYGAIAFNFGSDEEAQVFAYFPIVIIEGLPTCAFASKTSDAGFFIFMNKLGAFILLDCFGIVLPRVPYRKEDDFFTVGEFLYAEVSLVPTASHEVGTGRGGKDFHLNVKRVAFGCRVA